MTGHESPDEERLAAGYTGRLLLAVSLGWLVVQAGRLSLSPLLPAIRADLGISATAAGVALSLLWGLYALLQYPSGRLSDRLGRKTPLVAGLLLAAVGFGLVGRSGGYPAFLVGAAVVGLGAGLYPTPARALVSDLFVARRGQAFGIHTSSGDLGGVVAAGLASIALAVATWRAAIPAVVAAALLITFALHAWSREPYRLVRVDVGLGETFRRLLVGSRLRRLLVAYTLFAFTWQATVAFLPTYLRAGKAFAPVVANAGFAALFAVGVVAKFVAGGVADRVPRILLAPALLGLGAVSLAGVVLAGSPLLAGGFVVTFAVGLMAFPPVMQAHLMDSFPDDTAGGDLGATRSVYIGLGALGPTYVGVVADAASYELAFVGLVGCLLVGAVIVALLGRDRPGEATETG